MFYRSITWLICISAALATAIDHNEPNSITGPVPEDNAPPSRIDNLESSTVREVNGNSSVDLGSLLDAGDGAVATLVAGGTRLVAHTAVLAARSPVFAAMIHNGTPEAGSNLVAVPDVEGPVARQLVAYLYTLQAPQLPNMAVQLLAAADRYGVSALKAECERQVAAQLSVETAASTAVLAVRNSYSSLRKAAIAFIKSHIFHVMATKGWADAMRSQPEDLVKVTQLLYHSPTETSAPATGDSGTTATAQLQSGRSDRNQTRHVVALPSLAICPTPTFDDAAVSVLRRLSAMEKGRRLIKAANDGAVQELQTLLEAGAHVGARDEKRNTALHWAAWEGHVEAASCLMGAGADVGARNWASNTPLHWAAWGGRTAVARLLLASSADPDTRNEDGDTPLHFAAEHGRAGAAAALLDAGADRAPRNSKGRSPLDRARQFNQQHLVDMLRPN